MTSLKKTLVYPIWISGFLMLLTGSCKKSSDNAGITDIDGNVYHSISIGTQVWLVENLSVKHYRNGDVIPSVTDGTTWSSLSTGAYCDYDNSEGNSLTYGRLYNYFTVTDSRGLCPTGWHVPGASEFTTLTAYLGGETVAGGKLKETGTAHWQTPNEGATDESGFKALPGGYRFDTGAFDGIGSYADFWALTEPEVWRLNLRYDTQDLTIINLVPKNYGFSVRCIKDN
jgi:uncharacterized protein (TIGR02145 family)